ncbi:MAG: hypothetical protein L6R39_001022 [Caloplaca ligustica]|nr:MAG: hypothetical protein L6R39_001022 [Caloplaca ligustica]
MILVITIVCIWELQFPTPKKRRLSAVFFIGALAVLSSVARLGYVITVSKDPNQSVAITIVSMLKLLERFIGVVVSCMPILPAFLRHFRNTGSTAKSRSINRNANGEAGLSATILGSQRRNTTFISIGPKQSKLSKTKDLFPVYATMDDRLTTRGYEEIEEMKMGPRPPRELEARQPGEPKVDRGAPAGSRRVSHVPQNYIMKGTEVEVTFEER